MKRSVARRAIECTRLARARGERLRGASACALSPRRALAARNSSANSCLCHWLAFREQARKLLDTTSSPIDTYIAHGRLPRRQGPRLLADCIDLSGQSVAKLRRERHRQGRPAVALQRSHGGATIAALCETESILHLLERSRRESAQRSGCTATLAETRVFRRSIETRPRFGQSRPARLDSGPANLQSFPTTEICLSDVFGRSEQQHSRPRAAGLVRHASDFAQSRLAKTVAGAEPGPVARKRCCVGASSSRLQISHPRRRTRRSLNGVNSSPLATECTSPRGVNVARRQFAPMLALPSRGRPRRPTSMRCTSTKGRHLELGQRPPAAHRAKHASTERKGSPKTIGPTLADRGRGRRPRALRRKLAKKIAILAGLLRRQRALGLTSPRPTAMNAACTAWRGERWVRDPQPCN